MWIDLNGYCTCKNIQKTHTRYRLMVQPFAAIPVFELESNFGNRTNESKKKTDALLDKVPQVVTPSVLVFFVGVLYIKQRESQGTGLQKMK